MWRLCMFLMISATFFWVLWFPPQHKPGPCDPVYPPRLTTANVREGDIVVFLSARYVPAKEAGEGADSGCGLYELQLSNGKLVTGVGRGGAGVVFLPYFQNPTELDRGSHFRVVGIYSTHIYLTRD